MQQSAVWLSTFFFMDEDITLHQWSEFKEFFREKLELCSPKYLLDTLTKAQTRVGDLFPNIFQLLVIAECQHLLLRESSLKFS